MMARKQRPKDPSTQKAYYSGKKKCHTVKNNLIPFLKVYTALAAFMKCENLVSLAIAASV